MINLIVEKYLGSVRENWKTTDKDTDVFINPDSKELKEIMSGRDVMRIILPNNKDFIAFDAFTLHESVRRQLQLKNIITLQGYVYGRELSVMVTDNVRDTKWNNNPDTADFIRSNK